MISVCEGPISVIERPWFVFCTKGNETLYTKILPNTRCVEKKYTPNPNNCYFLPKVLKVPQINQKQLNFS